MRRMAELLTLVSTHNDHYSIYWSPSLEFYVNLSDVFERGATDAQHITDDDLEDLEKAYDDCKRIAGRGWYGSMLWACRKRRTRPTGATFQMLPKELYPLFLRVGPRRDLTNTNPHLAPDD